MSDEKTIVCDTCGVEKPVRLFRIRRTPALCRACHYQIPEIKEQARLYYQAPGVKERVIERTRQYRQRPGVKELATERMRQYRQRPEVKELDKQYRQTPEYKERNNERKRRYYQTPDGKERTSERKRRYCQTPEAKQLANARARHYSQQAEDVYIKGLIYSQSKGLLTAKDMPPQIIELKRQSLILKRTIKQKEDEQHTTTDV